MINTVKILTSDILRTSIFLNFDLGSPHLHSLTSNSIPSVYISVDIHQNLFIREMSPHRYCKRLRLLSINKQLNRADVTQSPHRLADLQVEVEHNFNINMEYILTNYNKRQK